MAAAKLLTRRISVSRTRSPIDAAISPFLIDGQSVHYQTRLAHGQYTGTWLKLPVHIRHMPSREAALIAVHQLSALRHPNLEQLLGGVVDRCCTPSIVTECINGVSLSVYLPVNVEMALAIAIDVSRALMYYHAATNSPHAAVCAQNILYDDARHRAVLMLTNERRTRPPSAAPEVRLGAKASVAADVFSVGTVILQLFSGRLDSYGMEAIDMAPPRLRRVLCNCRRTDPSRRPSMQTLCEQLELCLDAFLRQLSV